MEKKYYVGLDCGTSSVGWAATDEKYNLLRKRGKTLWGMRLFEEAQTAAERRTVRSSRRRLARMQNRLKLLRMIFSDEISAVDPYFYIRLNESFFLEEDKIFEDKKANSKNTLFNDQNYKDKDFYKKYPTIWHLRNAIIMADKTQSFDIREYFLAIQHILKNRGHFLVDGNFEGAGNFDDIWDSFCDICKDLDFPINTDNKDTIEGVLKKKMSKIDKKKMLAKEIFSDSFSGDTEISGLLCGSKVALKKIFNLDSEEDPKISFSEGVFEEKLAEIEPAISSINGAIELLLAAKQIYDYIYLSDLLAGSQRISEAMVRNYELHKSQLAQIKTALKPFKEDYDYFFKTLIKTKDDEAFYNAYIGKAYSEDKSGRRKSYTVDQEAINKGLEKLFKKHNICENLLPLATERQLLPKQRGQAKGTIPQQLHHNELELILKKLEKDFPSFAMEVDDEDEAYNTKSKKILSIHSFRIPYYCGPIKHDERLKESEPRRFWGDSEINEIVYPWNFKQLVNLSARANGFIRHMTNECTYVLGADVLPKSSLLYQKYMVLNELNNLKVNGSRITQDLKSVIYERGYISGELKGNISLRQLNSWLHSTGLISDSDEVSGTSETKVLPKLSSYADFKRILGDSFNKEYPESELDQVVNLITILNNERKMLADKICETLNCSYEQAVKLAKLNYKDWGNFSAEFLKNIRANINGSPFSIIEALEKTPNNLMELLSEKFEFKKELDNYNSVNKTTEHRDILYSDIEALYCSPAVKRTVWQAVKIVKDLKRALGAEPSKIFLEVTRGEEDGYTKSKNNKDRLARRKKLIESYRAITNNPEAKALLADLNNDEKYSDRDLQSKKLFLYYSQMGRCAYSGEPIDLDELNNTRLYDIDHIFPRSLTKDDSITRNLVLVKAEYNREKTNVYPIKSDWREKMAHIWAQWRRYGLITKEKYERLIRSTPLSEDELAGFISRQIVETSQSVKAIRDIFQQFMPDTKVVLVKAKWAHDMRDMFAKGERYENSDEYKVAPRPEFIKIRELNDLHHAKDAYLNIVAGNVTNSTFTDNPRDYVLRRKDQSGDRYNYTILTKRIFRDSETYTNKNGVSVNWPFVKAWDFADSIKIVSDTMKRNDVSWTKMSYEESGAISDLQLVGKSEKAEGVLPIKNNERLAKTDKYGGYNSIKGAFFALIETPDSKRKLVQIPIYAKQDVDRFISKNYSGAKIIVPKILFKSLIKINGTPLHLAGRTGNSIVFHNAKQLYLPANIQLALKKILSVSKKLSEDKKYTLTDRDSISNREVDETFDALSNRMQVFVNIPLLGSKMPEILEHSDDFKRLSLEEKIRVIPNMLKTISCGAECGDISTFVPKSSQIGKIFTANTISNFDSVKLVAQSATGIYEKVIDLKTCGPCEV